MKVLELERSYFLLRFVGDGLISERQMKLYFEREKTMAQKSLNVDSGASLALAENANGFRWSMALLIGASALVYCLLKRSGILER